ncbi:hypothetical protein CALVIDRAFT_275606 [Calocera viscosa TUFC12733]|uniref:Uncharacterized protein n=1 Tax=Calocera viscosa (strain TUFC12733) TaxID=1330018 RepID=A0A167R0D5_CALVF|nr:hypothetical protein CALVIDRAFT_275606 [Calocera viscosa TUFC12733]
MNRLQSYTFLTIVQGYSPLPYLDKQRKPSQTKLARAKESRKRRGARRVKGCGIQLVRGGSKSFLALMTFALFICSFGVSGRRCCFVKSGKNAKGVASYTRIGRGYTKSQKIARLGDRRRRRRRRSCTRKPELIVHRCPKVYSVS